MSVGWGQDCDEGVEVELWGECYNIEETTEIHIFDSGLTGEIPPEIGDLINLEWLYLSYNQLTGEIPSEISNLLNLEWLYLYGNQLVGEIPDSICNLVENDCFIGISNNQLCPPYPDCLTEEDIGYQDTSNCEEPSLCDEEIEVELWGECYNIEETTTLILSDLTGEIPPEIGNLTNLIGLVLSSNQFIGEIPPEIGNLTNLTGLFLNNNQLTGRIPSEIGNLTNLTNLDLSDNELTEEIPPEIGNLTNLFQLLLNNNQLMGEIPESICNIDIFWISFPYFDIDNNQLCPPYPDCISEEDIGYQDTSECEGPSLCDEGYTEIDGECYYQSDLDVVQDFINSNESLYGYSPITLTSPNNWLNGHLKTFLLYDRDITSIPESIGNLDGLEMIYFFENEIESVP